MKLLPLGFRFPNGSKIKEFLKVEVSEIVLGAFWWVWRGKLRGKIEPGSIKIDTKRHQK